MTGMAFKDEIDYAMTRSRAWRGAQRRMDNGSYCENAEPKAVDAAKITDLYQTLADALIEYERKYV